MHVKQFQEDLMNWYEKEARDLPWRRESSPYGIWVSEMMLQQTRVETVIPYYNRFMKAFPDVFDLALGEEDQLLKLWQGLGYYARARNLKKGAEMVVKNYQGKIPEDRDELMKIPGIGPYMSSAIASMAFQKPVASLDGNLYRVLARIFLWEEEIKGVHSRRVLADLAENLLCRERPGDFNQAMMDLGATICIPNGAPLCGQCPVSVHCQAYREEKTDSIPVKTVKKPRKILDKTVFLVRYPNHVVLRKRPNQGLLASLWEFPNVDGHLSWKQAQHFLKLGGIMSLDFHEIGDSKHIFSHIEWRMKGYEIVLNDRILITDAFPYSQWQWVEVDMLHQEYSIPSAFRDYMKLL